MEPMAQPSTCTRVYSSVSVEGMPTAILFLHLHEAMLHLVPYWEYQDR